MNKTVNLAMTRKGIVIVAVLLGTTLWAREKNAPEPPVQSVVTCEVRFIEAPRADINKLLPNTGYVLKEETLQKLQEMVDQKKAVILAQPRISTISGAQAQVRSVREFIYPTEFEPPTIVTTNITAHGDVIPKDVIQMAGSIPGGFKTRELGTLFNITPSVSSDQKLINITLIPEISQPSTLGFVKYNTKSSFGITEVTQPDFYSWNLTTSVVLKSGSTVVISVLDAVANEKYTAQETVVLVLLAAAVNRAE